MIIEQNQSLKSFNTFAIDTRAEYFARIKSKDDLHSLVAHPLWSNNPHFILGGGSNLLLPPVFNGIVVKNEIRGIEIVDQTTEAVFIKAGAGENWHQFVLHCIANGFAGIENLSLIPGTVGATPIQNIGAYGVELKDVFHQLTAFDLESQKIRVFSRADCAFAYRDSVFKNDLKNKMVVMDVTLKLAKHPVLHLEYSGIREQLNRMGVEKPSIQDVSQAVIALRQSKLPDPNVLPNAGSFFKNPVVAIEQFQDLLQHYPNMPNYPQPNQVKIPAGWLIEQAGWKGKRCGKVGVYEKQALVIVNFDNGSSEEIQSVAKQIQFDVNKQFGIALCPEVEWITS